MATVDGDLDDTISWWESADGTFAFAMFVGDDFKAFQVLSLGNGIQDTVSEGVAISETYTLLPGVLLRDRVKLPETYDTTTVYGLLVSDAAVLRDALLGGRAVDVADAVTISETLRRGVAVRVLEKLGIANTLAGAAKYGMRWTDVVRLTDQLIRFVGGDVTDTIALTPSWTSQLRARKMVAESVALADTLVPRFLLNVVAQDDVEIDAQSALQMLFQPTLREMVQISAAYLSPGGGFTAWTMNTRTAAVTEYDNFAFNSFARIGNKYIGATETGLYELNGDTDDGDPVIARIKSGFMQFGGVQLSRVKAAYIGMRGEGDFILRIETGDGARYDYAVPTRNLRTTKVHMGKGQRARYFSFELISAGADFDLDSIEFVPLVVQRRV